MFSVPFRLVDPATQQKVSARALLYKLGVEHKKDIPILLTISEYLSYLEQEMMFPHHRKIAVEARMPTRIKRLRKGAALITVIILASLLGSLFAEIIARFLHSTLPVYGQIVAMAFIVVIVAISIMWIVERRKLLKVKGDQL